MKVNLEKQERHGINLDAEKIILGSFPGKDSLKSESYYANPQNQFWYLLGIKKTASKEEKEILLKKLGIGVWDVIKSCERDGSLDSNIKNKTIEYNNFKKISGKKLFFNGTKAKKCFKKWKKDKDCEFECEVLLPSSSAANTRWTLEEKKTKWQKFLLGSK